MTCTCEPRRRCQPCSERSRATLRLLRIAPDPRVLDPVTYWDRRTSLADARAALCLASGVPIDLIDPAGGYGPAKSSAE